MTGMSEAVAFLALPFVASVIFVLIHAYLGVHVLRRKIVFADLALAQLSALGASVAFANGYDVKSPAGFAYAFMFTAIGAALLTVTRNVARAVSHEAVVGILYVVATAATILVVDRSPLGAEHVKKILVGSIVTVDAADIAKFALLYAVIGLLHWWLRRPLLSLSSEQTPRGRGRLEVWSWDFLFFVTFGLVVTSSVTTAGVLLVFSLLIVPAVVGFMFSDKVSVVLVIAWSAGIAATAAGLACSYALDLPTGATMVTTLAGFLVIASVSSLFIAVDSETRRSRLMAAARTVVAAFFVCILVSSLWLIADPSGDQPLFAVFERTTGIGPATFLSASEGDIYQSAARDIVRFQGEVDRLDAMEKTARYQATPLADDEIRRIASYQQSFNEMARGERFVRDVLQIKARAHERWMIGVPAAIISLAGLGLSMRWFSRGRRREGGSNGTQQRIEATY